MNHGRKILDVRKEETNVEELTAAVVGGAEGIRKYRESKGL
jgi:simple sugar transport system ATP-binding protein